MSVRTSGLLSFPGSFSSGVASDQSHYSGPLRRLESIHVLYTPYPFACIAPGDKVLHWLGCYGSLQVTTDPV